MQKITVPAGPEDMGIMLIEGQPQILVSSTPRKGTVFHSIVSTERGAFSLINPETDDVREIPVLDRDGSELTPFCPHGIYVVPDRNLVVAVSHEPTGDGYTFADHALLLEYRDHAFHLTHRSAIRLANGNVGDNDANDIVYRNGIVFVSMLSSNCVAYARVPEAGTEWDWKQLEKVRLANGMEFHEGDFLVCSSLCGTINAYALDEEGFPAGERRRLRRLGGVLDNFTRQTEDVLHLAAIVNPIRYLIHSIFRSFTSPTRFYEVRPDQGFAVRELFLNGRKRIPIQAGSTILRHGDAFYFSQVFDPYVLKIPADQIVYEDRPV